MDQAFVEWLMADVFGLGDTSRDLPAWYADAACPDRNDVAWFPERGEDWRPALSVCEGFEVCQECLDDALVHEDGLGRMHRSDIWGGLTPGRRPASPNLGIALTHNAERELA